VPIEEEEEVFQIGKVFCIESDITVISNNSETPPYKAFFEEQDTQCHKSYMEGIWP
jgi:hypothetical protein